MKSFSIATFNVNYICNGDGCKNAAKVAKSIIECDADIVCLQESNAKWEEFLRKNDEINNIFQTIRFHNHSNPWGGFALFSKFPIENWELIKETDRSWYPAGVVTLRIGSESDETSNPLLLQVLVVHLRAPLEFSPEPYWWGGRVNWVGGFFSKRVKAKRLDEIKTFSDELDPSLPAVVVGDFNEPSSSSRCLQYLERELNFRNLPKKSMNGLGILPKNSWSFKLGFLTLLSFDYDHIVYSKRHLRPVEDKADVGGDSGSDHRLVSAKLSFLPR